MFPILFLPVGMAKKYLAQNRKQKVLILGAGQELGEYLWLQSIFKNRNHQQATFSLFSLPMSNSELICRALTERFISGRSRWENAASHFWLDVVDLAKQLVADGEDVSFGEALKRTGFDLSFESLVRCAFDENGKIKAFIRTLRNLTIQSLSDTSRVSIQENYQYITMQISRLFQEHQSRLSSPLLVEINQKTLSKFDAVLMVEGDVARDSWWWQKESEILAALTMRAT